MSTARLLALMALLTALAVSPAAATPLFENEDVIEIELVGPIGTLIDGASTDAELPFTLRAEGVEHQIKVRLRGKSRLRVCSFPPLRLNFVASAVDDTVFEDQDKLKLVTHCRDSERSEQDMLLEYAAYRVFNVISEAGYRVRQVRIHYIDTSNEDATIGPKYGFLIETPEEVGERIGAEEVELEGIARSAVEPLQASLVYIFNYLIGNTDWSLVTADEDEYCCHNLHLFSGEQGTFTIPYDLDLSGLVNARYAEPDPSLGIDRVTRRLYRGYCVSPEALASALDQIIGLKAEILAVPAAVAGLSDREAERAREYLEGFFDQAENRDRLLSRFEQRCL